jgi:acetyl-CoA C-acetyltransferase
MFHFFGRKFKRLYWQRAEQKRSEKIKQFTKIRFKDIYPLAPMNLEPRTGLSMGGHTEITAKYYGISREEQDVYALESHRKWPKHTTRFS